MPCELQAALEPHSKKMLYGTRCSPTVKYCIASVARRLATEYVDPKGLEALLANRGIAIDKCPGLRVGVGEIVRRIIGKTVMSVTGEKVQEAVGALQLCAGQPAGVESAIHAMRGFLDDDQSEGILLMQTMPSTESTEQPPYATSTSSAPQCNTSSQTSTVPPLASS